MLLPFEKAGCSLCCDVEDDGKKGITLHVRNNKPNLKGDGTPEAIDLEGWYWCRDQEPKEQPVQVEVSLYSTVGTYGSWWWNKQRIIKKQREKKKRRREKKKILLVLFHHCLFCLLLAEYNTGQLVHESVYSSTKHKLQNNPEIAGDPRENERKHAPGRQWTAQSYRGK